MVEKSIPQLYFPKREFKKFIYPQWMLCNPPESANYNSRLRKGEHWMNGRESDIFFHLDTIAISLIFLLDFNFSMTTPVQLIVVIFV